MLWMTVSPAQLISNRIIFNFATHDRMAISITFLFGMQTSNTSKKHEIALLHPLFLDTFATKVTKSSKSQNTTEKVSHLLLKWTLFGINLPRLRRGSLLHLLLDIWSTYGRHMVDIWSTYGRHMVKVWSTYGRYCLHMVDIWSTYGIHMVYIWSTYGRHMVHI